MDATIHNVKSYVGDTITWEVTVTEDGAARNITSDTIRATINFDTPVDLTEGDGITVTDAANGVFQVTVTDAQTNVSAGVYTYGIKLEDASGNEYTIVVGTITLTAERVA